LKEKPEACPLIVLRRTSIQGETLDPPVRGWFLPFKEYKFKVGEDSRKRQSDHHPPKGRSMD